MQTGTIKKLVSDRGFGFIQQEGGKDLFFHAKDLADGLLFEDLREGDMLQFEVEEGPKGPAAVNVSKVQSDDDQ